MTCFSPVSFLYNFEQKRKIPPIIPKIGNEFDLYGLISVDSAAIRSKASGLADSLFTVASMVYRGGGVVLGFFY